MVGATGERRLVAILAADIVGYSRLMEANEGATLAAIRSLRAEVIDPVIAEYRGRIIKLMGDGTIVEFVSVVDAVSAAVAIQKGAAEHERRSPSARRIVFRIGVNLGDVVVEDGDLYGDGVNVAARLEQLCRPGGVMISGTTYDHMQGKLGLPLDFTGHQRVKNIARPIRSYQVRIDGVRTRRRLLPRRVSRSGIVAAAVVLFVVVAGGAWLWLTRAAAAKPSVAVLPFENLGSDDATGRLADGMTEDTITDLARYREFDVIARHSTEVHKGRAVDIRQIGRDLNVGYVIEGSIQRQADQLRVTVQLIKASDGSHIWSDRWDRPATGVFTVQSEIAERVANQLGGFNLIFNEVKTAAARKRPTDLTAYDLFVLANEVFGTRTEETDKQAISLLDQAIARDPGFARAYVRKGFILYHLLGFRQDTHEGFLEMERLGRTAVRIDPNDAMAHMLVATSVSNLGRNKEASEEIDHALTLNPSSADVLVFAADNYPFLGKPEQGAAMCERAFRLNPNPPPFYNSLCGPSFFFSHRLQDAVEALTRYRATNTLNAPLLGVLAMAQDGLGHEREATVAIAEFTTRFPKFSFEFALNNGWIFDRGEEERFALAGWRKVGLRVCATDDELKSAPVLKRLSECIAKP